MASHLSLDEMELIERLEDGKPLDDLAKSFTLVDRLNAILVKANDLYNRVYRKGNKPYEITGPMTLPCHMTGSAGVTRSNISMIGMEEVELDRLVATSQGNIVGVFTSDEYPNTEIFIMLDNFEKVLGKRGGQLANWFEFTAHVKEKRAEIIDSERARLSRKDYEEVGSFGSW